jgi:hypothetical protein
MKRLLELVALIGLSSFVSGCMHTVVSGGAPSADNRYSLCMEKHGASGKAYVDFSKKRVYLSIWKEPSDYLSHDGEELFAGKYVLQAADLCQSVHWQGVREVTVDFFDFGDKVSVYAMKKDSPSNYISSLTFVFDASTGKFVEKK